MATTGKPKAKKLQMVEDARHMYAELSSQKHMKGDSELSKLCCVRLWLQHCRSLLFRYPWKKIPKWCEQYFHISTITQLAPFYINTNIYSQAVFHPPPWTILSPRSSLLQPSTPRMILLVNTFLFQSFLLIFLLEKHHLSSKILPISMKVGLWS